MVEVWRARTAPGPREESSACLIPSSFRLGPPPSDRTLMSTRYKPLQGSTTVVGGGPASALLETALPVRYFPSTIRSQKSEHVTRRGMSRATTPLLGPGVCDATCGRQVVLRLPPRSSACTPYTLIVGRTGSLTQLCISMCWIACPLTPAPRMPRLVYRMAPRTWAWSHAS